MRHALRRVCIRAEPDAAWPDCADPSDVTGAMTVATALVTGATARVTGCRLSPSVLPGYLPDSSPMLSPSSGANAAMKTRPATYGC